ncbi:hypothetical protein EDD86DRAFT_205739 [Gorgonomyces haynaldii]|nr:hypothetical protein EDD86DRAFT_205739 [Gorgonomyces haynaldii]
MSDSRFSKAQTDPKFKRPKKDASKVAIDSRFASVLRSDFDQSKQPAVDKYGRPRKTTNSKELKKFYKMEEEEEEDFVDFARGEGMVESSDESEIEDVVEEEIGPYADEQIPLGDETHRLACVHLDWDNLKARDLYKVFDAFKPKHGMIKSVAIYVSDFGKQRLQEEAVQGPPKEIFDDEDDRLVKEDTGTEFNVDKLRKYQLERLRYYYAVVETDSVATAKAIFEQCDGTEFESSGNFFDLRYIPMDMEFTDEPHDFADAAPVVYEPSDFVTNALQHSKVKLTWDDDDPERTKITKRKFTKDQLQDMDFKAYLATDSEQSDADLDTLKLLLGEEEEDKKNELEITFTPGLSEKASKLLEERKEREKQKDETVFEQMQRKRKEKKKMKKLEEEEFSEGELPDDPFFQEDFGSDFEAPEKPEKPKNHKNAKKQDKKVSKKEKAELELLMLDNNESKHFNMKDVIKSEKPKRKKQKQLVGETQDDFEIDLVDPRFKSVTEDYQMAIDPTNPQYLS